MASATRATPPAASMIESNIMTRPLNRSTIRVNGCVEGMNTLLACFPYRIAMKRRHPLGDRLRALREARGLNQTQAAAEIGLSRSYLAGIEGGHSLPGRDKLVAIATFYDISVDEVLASASPEVPEGAQLVDQPDEIALLRFWRGLDDAQRLAVLTLLGADRNAAKAA